MTRKNTVASQRFPVPHPSTLTIGVLLAFATAIVSGVSIWVNSYAVAEVKDPAVFAAAKNSVVGMAFVVAFLAMRRPSRHAPRPRTVRPRLAAALVALAVVGGSVPFVLFFEGLARAGAGDGAFIQKTLFIWVAVLAVPLLGEKLGPWHLFALAMLAVAQWFIGHPASFEAGQGEAMVFAATLLWAVEVTIARRVLPATGVRVGATARMAIGGVLLIGYLGVTGKLGTLFQLDAGQWRWVLGTAAILFVYVATWYGALRRAPATVVTSILTLGAPITAFLSTTASGRAAPNAEQLAGYAVVVAAAAILGLVTLRRPDTAAAGELA